MRTYHKRFYYGTVSDKYHSLLVGALLGFAPYTRQSPAPLLSPVPLAPDLEASSLTPPPPPEASSPTPSPPVHALSRLPLHRPPSATSPRPDLPLSPGGCLLWLRFAHGALPLSLRRLASGRLGSGSPVRRWLVPCLAAGAARLPLLRFDFYA